MRRPYDKDIELMWHRVGKTLVQLSPCGINGQHTGQDQLFIEDYKTNKQVVLNATRGCVPVSI